LSAGAIGEAGRGWWTMKPRALQSRARQTEGAKTKSAGGDGDNGFCEARERLQLDRALCLPKDNRFSHHPPTLL
jgi:hypothetical protein